MTQEEKRIHIENCEDCLNKIEDNSNVTWGLPLDNEVGDTQWHLVYDYDAPKIYTIDDAINALDYQFK